MSRLLQHQSGVMRKHHHVGRRDAILHFSPYFLDNFDRVSGVVGQVDVEAIISVAELGEEVKKCLVERTVYNKLVLSSVHLLLLLLRLRMRLHGKSSDTNSEGDLSLS